MSITPASAYPRGMSTGWSVSLATTESATFTATASAPDIDVRFSGCSVPLPNSCTIAANGAVHVNTDGDTTASEPVTLTLTGTATPAVTIPLHSTEGAPMQPSARVLTVKATATGTTTGAPMTRTVSLPVTTNSSTQSVLELTTLLPTDPTVAVRGGAVPYRATLTRTGNLAAETPVHLRLLPGTSGTSGTDGAATALVMIAPGVTSVTVQLSAQVPVNAPEGVATWRLQAVWGVDDEVGTARSFTVPPAPPAPAPDPTPVPVPVTPAPLPVPPAPQPQPVAAAAKPSDDTPPAVGVRLLTGTRMTVAPGVRPRIGLRFTCPKNERSCVLRTTLTWKRTPTSKPILLGVGTLRLKGGTAGRSSFLLSTGARALLRRHGMLRTLLLVTATDASGNVATGRLPVTLTLARPSMHH